jgi:CspA family cold shock protein
VVTRFDAGRGFGFVALDGGAGDAFLHVSVLQRAGAEAVAPGTRLRVRVGRGQKGPQVTEVLEVDETGDAPPPPRAGRAVPPHGDDGAGEEVRGTVKWYDAGKGFGFVTPEGGGRDVFVHASALGRSGMAALAEGQAVVLRVVQGRKGPEAETVRDA